MTHTMPALVLNGPGDVQVAEKPIPTPGPGEVVLAVEATTICGTDLRIISGEKTAGVRPGVTLGHEIAGRIASLARGWKDWLSGNRQLSPSSSPAAPAGLASQDGITYVATASSSVTALMVASRRGCVCQPKRSLAATSSR